MLTVIATLSRICEEAIPHSAVFASFSGPIPVWPAKPEALNPYRWRRRRRDERHTFPFPVFSQFLLWVRTRKALPRARRPDDENNRAAEPNQYTSMVIARPITLLINVAGSLLIMMMSLSEWLCCCCFSNTLNLNNGKSEEKAQSNIPLL